MLGFCLPQIWMFVVVQGGNPLSPESNIAFHGALGGAALLAAILYLACPNLGAPLLFNRVCSLVMCILPLYSIFVPFASQNEAVTFALAFASGVACAGSFLFWIALSARSGLKDAICYLLLAFALAAASRLLFALLPSTLALALSLPVALSSIPLGNASSQVPCKASYRPKKDKSSHSSFGKGVFDKATMRQLAFVLLEFACYGIVLGLLRGLSSESQQTSSYMTLNYCLRIVIALLLFSWFGLYEHRKSVARIAQISFFFLIIAFFAFVLLDERTFLLVTTSVSFLRGVVLMLLTITAVEVAVRLRTSPLVTYGIARALYEFTTILGIALDDQMQGIGFSTAASLDIILFVIVCFLLVLANRTMHVIKAFDKESTPVERGGSAFQQLDASCDALATRYGLTERETDVFKLLCKGRSKAHIAEVLCISENTVRHHSKNLYSKLEVHNKQELMNLIGLD